MRRDLIERRITEFLADDASQLGWMKPVVRASPFLPLHVGWVKTIGLRPDGSFVVWDHEEGAVPRPLSDPYWERVALCQGADKYPEFRELLPERPPPAIDCASCGGTGEIATGETGSTAQLLCACGGLGWLLPGEGPGVARDETAVDPSAAEPPAAEPPKRAGSPTPTRSTKLRQLGVNIVLGGLYVVFSVFGFAALGVELPSLGYAVMMCAAVGILVGEVVVLCSWSVYVAERRAFRRLSESERGDAPLASPWRAHFAGALALFAIPVTLGMLAILVEQAVAHWPP